MFKITCWYTCYKRYIALNNCYVQNNMLIHFSTRGTLLLTIVMFKIICWYMLQEVHCSYQIVMFKITCWYTCYKRYIALNNCYVQNMFKRGTLHVDTLATRGTLLLTNVMFKITCWYTCYKRYIALNNCYVQNNMLIHLLQEVHCSYQMLCSK